MCNHHYNLSIVPHRHNWWSSRVSRGTCRCKPSEKAFRSHSKIHIHIHSLTNIEYAAFHIKPNHRMLSIEFTGLPFKIHVKGECVSAGTIRKKWWEAHLVCHSKLTVQHHCSCVYWYLSSSKQMLFKHTRLYLLDMFWTTHWSASYARAIDRMVWSRVFQQVQFCILNPPIL